MAASTDWKLIGEPRLKSGLIGEPRLKNGLTYYPGVEQAAHGIVMLGNVVHLRLQAPDQTPYEGYGFLKGLWLWRDQPYLRVQYMAVARADLPEGAIAYRTEPDPRAAKAELLVTNRVGDLHLDALLGPVLVDHGPLVQQLFQDNVSAELGSFSCTRHLDPTTQRVQHLDDAFRLTPVVQQFPRAVLRALLDEGGSPARRRAQPAGVAALGAEAAANGCATPKAMPTATPTTTATDFVFESASTLAPKTPAAPETGSCCGSPLPSSARSERRRAAREARARIEAEVEAARGDSPSTPTGADGGAVSVRVSSDYEREMRAAASMPGSPGLRGRAHSPGLGPRSERGAVLLHATWRGALGRTTVTLRCADTVEALRSKCASIFGLVEPSVKIVFREQPRRWKALSSASQLLEALERQPELNAVPIEVGGEPRLSMPALHACSVALHVANLVAAALFAISVAAAPPPWRLAALVPPTAFVYSLYASFAAMRAEYLSNPGLRGAALRRDGNLLALVAASALGPTAALLAASRVLRQFRFGVSKAAEQQLNFWSAGMHVVLDLPMLTINLMMHSRLGVPWEPTHTLALALGALSLICNGAWHLGRLLTISPAADEVERSGSSPALRKKRSQEELDRLQAGKPPAFEPQASIGWAPVSRPASPERSGMLSGFEA